MSPEGRERKNRATVSVLSLDFHSSDIFRMNFS